MALKNLINIFKKKKINLFIQASSSLEYGNIKSPQNEKNKCAPVSHYGKAKHKATKYLMKDNFFFNYIVLRLYQVYGPYQKIDRLIPITINSCLKNKKFKCTDGTQKRDFLFIDDFIDLIVKILKKKKIKSGIYNVGSGKPLYVNYIIKKINFIIKKGYPLFGAIKMRKDESSSLYPNTNKIKKNFNWLPKTSFLEGIKKTINYYEN